VQSPLIQEKTIKRLIMRLRQALQALCCSLILILLSLYVSMSSGPKTTVARISGINNATKSRLASLSVDNTIVIVPVNSGMLMWVENLLCSLAKTSFEATNIVFWTLDPDVQVILSDRGYSTYYDSSLYAVSTNENLHDDTRNFKKMMKERPKFFIDILSTGLDILFLDADTVFFQSPLKLPDPTVDAVFSSDSREFFNTENKDPFRDVWRRGSRFPPVCNGIFWMKSNERTIKIWRDILDVFEAGLYLAVYRALSFKDDQRGMDVLLNDGRARLAGPLPDGITEDMLQGRYSSSPELDVRLLDQTSVVSGHLLKNRGEQYEMNLARLIEKGEGRISVHFNWDPKELVKEEGARQMGLWFLTDEGRCMHDV